MKRAPSPPSLLPGAVLVLALAAAGCHSPAEKAAAPLVEKNVAARGGLKAWKAVKAMSFSGNLDAGKRRDPVKLAMNYLKQRTQTKGEMRRAVVAGAAAEPEKQIQLPFLMELARPRKMRVEIKFQGETAVQVYDGKSGWKLRPFLGRHEVEPFTAEELRIASQQSELDGPLIDASSKGTRVELEGTEQVDGRDAYKLKLTTGKDVRRVWVDKETFLDVKVDSTRRIDGKQRQVWTYLRDYKPVNGVMVPHSMETTIEGVPGSEKIVIDRVVVNPDLDDDRFKKPT